MNGTDPGGREAAFELAHSDDASVLLVRGDVDAVSAPALRAHLVMAIEEVTSRLRIDLSQVSFIDSRGLSVLIAAHRRAEEAGITLELASPSESCRRVFEITRLTDLFTIVD